MPPAPLAFGFANLAMLGWLAAAAAPILIHLWMRQTHRETAWAAVRFLRAALEKQARRLRLQHWILLAVRTALLLLVVLAAAKPFLDRGIFAGGVPTHRVLVVDASLSMSSITSDGESFLERAKRHALAIIDDARAGDRYSVVVMGVAAEASLGRPTSEVAAARRAVETIAPTEGVADLPAALALSQQLVQRAQSDGGVSAHEVILLSDLAENSWTPLTSDDGQQVCQDLANLAQLTAIDVSGSRLPNAAVTSIAMTGPPPTLTTPLEIVAEAKLFGREAETRTAELLVDGAKVAEQPIALQPAQVTPIDFLHRFASPGPKAIEVRLLRPEGADRLAEDDRRMLGVTLRPRVRVLCVAGAPGACRYLADALAPEGEGSLEPVTISSADLPSIDLREYACVFLSNIRELSTEEAQRLVRYVEQGGGVAVFLGDRVNADRYNEVLAPSQVEPADAFGGRPSRLPIRLVSNHQPVEAEPDVGESHLLPGWLRPSISAPSYRIDPLGYSHPIASPFNGQQRAGLLTTPVSRHFPMELADNARVSVALALENGDPLLVTSEVGRGRIAVLATAATLASIDPTTGQPWTALPAWPSFLPIVRGIVNHLAKDQKGAAVLVGEPIVGVAPDRSTTRVAIDLPEPGAQSVVTPDEQGTWEFLGADQSGVYRVADQGSTPTAAIAVNIDPAESDPATVAVDRLSEVIELRQSTPELGVAVDAPRSTPLHRWLLYGALTLALVEPALACWFGRPVA